jgi:alkanesulfonate monooxygenase SsuD/methylene tetrahydromethanopterin reductase-like flavin-dependent oxidoreductase (luciferase family)
LTAPSLRGHQAIVAQVFVTLANMLPNRVILGLGRGGALNEVTSGNLWTNNSERFTILHEVIKLINNLWKEE